MDVNFQTVILFKNLFVKTTQKKHWKSKKYVLSWTKSIQIKKIKTLIEKLTNKAKEDFLLRKKEGKKSMDKWETLHAKQIKHFFGINSNYVSLTSSPSSCLWYSPRWAGFEKKQQKYKMFMCPYVQKSLISYTLGKFKKRYESRNLIKFRSIEKRFFFSPFKKVH